jgi:intein/homing endonuclease
LAVVAKDVFGLRGYSYKKDNTLRLTFHSKLLHEFLVTRLGMPAGKKSYTVKIPEEMLGKYAKHLPALIRGIYNTDGCVFFDRRYNPHYPRVYLKMINRRLIAQVYDVLESLHLNPTITIDGFVIQINGFQNVKRFIQKIGFSNPRHINRIKKNCPGLLSV